MTENLKRCIQSSDAMIPMAASTPEIVRSVSSSPLYAAIARAGALHTTIIPRHFTSSPDMNETAFLYCLRSSKKKKTSATLISLPSAAEEYALTKPG